jgi:N-acetylglucosamine kinase-like BadF-type ATPase
MGRAALLQWLNDPGAGSEALRLGIESVFGTLIEGELVRAVYGGSPGPTLAKLAGTCFTCAKQGEEWASRAVNEQLGRLAQVVAKHADQHFPGKNPINLSLAGGVWKEGKMVVEVFEATLRDARPGIAWSPGILKRPPVLGAVALAKEMDR